ncbi:DUF4760 domain-containing protein [Marinomonas algarum]|uniref:DUF4760 domain-containing protein n=1 Tax=Marinomonas algarum TaxID=2883105 RepID=A0A9X1IMB9_9GAMM|nr:DUF4760 domain-containing protein [Marinomonas algarum]MCB5161537.1 DUF4760 domain-containing protein [Marinomonas algarum]
MEFTLLQTYLSQINVDTLILAVTTIAALYSVRRNTTINCRRATVDLVLHQKNDSDLKAANLVVNPLLRDENISITKYSDKTHIGSEERTAILFVLNNYEFIATGIREKAFDFNLFKRMRCGTVLRDWEEFQPFIYELRKINKHPTMYQEFEWLAKKLEDNPLKKEKIR